MDKETGDLKSVLDALHDLADCMQYYCIGVYGVKDSFVDESLARARKVCSAARKKLEEENYDSQTSNSRESDAIKNTRKSL